MMKQIGGMVGIIVLLSGAIAAQDKAAQQADIAKVVVEHERRLYEAVAKSDKAAFEALVLPDGTWTTAAGFVPMRMLAEGLTMFELPHWEIVNPRVTWTGADSALVLYARSGGGRYAGQPLPATMLASTLWTRRDGKWIAVHHQETGRTQ